MAVSMAFAAGVVASLITGLAYASEYIADAGDEEHVPVVVRDFFIDRGGADRAMQADLGFARNMARHHQGAVDMAVYYLNDPRGTNPVIRRLASAIIHNQDFEIAVLDVIRKHVEAGPETGPLGILSLSRGIDGLEHSWRFVKAAQPSAADIWLSSGMQVTAFDVQFARPMIVHHRAAVDMAMRYNRNPDGGSSIIGPMNIGIMTDQDYEIGLMRRLLARYPGDPHAVPDDPKMMELMQRSMAGMHGGHHGGH
jgi:uncharacterized protein (DUF305 family)